MSDTFNTTVTNWQGVDDNPTAGSNNLVKSGGIYNVITDLGHNSFFNLVNFIPKSSFKYIKYSDGSLNNSGTPALNVFSINSERIKRIKAFVTGADNIAAAIAFYSSDVVSTESYLGGVQMIPKTTGGTWYGATVPDNTKLICVTNHADYLSNPIILVDTTERQLFGVDIEPISGSDKFVSSEGIAKFTTIRNSQFPSTSSGAWIRYSNGEVVSSSSVRLYKFLVDDSNPITKVTAKIAIDINIAAIAFYSSDTPSTNTYLGGVVGKNTNNILTYQANVPVGCKLICISTMPPTSDYSILLEYPSNILLVNLRDKLNNLEWINVPLSNPLRGWIKHGTGVWTPSNATYTYVFDANFISKLRCFLKSDTTVIDGIAFYSSDTIDEAHYLSSSIAWKGNYPNGAYYNVSIPTEAKIACVTSNIQDNFIPRIYLLIEEASKYLGNEDKKIVSDINNNSSQLKRLNGNIIMSSFDDIYHFGMTAVADRTVINQVPSQSIWDIRYAKKLGYKCIEANLHKTSDGKYVVTHGQNGGLGHDFDDLQGNDAAGVSISNNTLSYLQENYVYHTDIVEYRVPITTLEEFCAEAKVQNIVVMLMYKDVTSLSIAKGILGDNLLWLYNAPRSAFSGPILEYLSYSTKEEIVNRCISFGAPYVYSMANPSDFTDSELQDICATLHSMGCYVASAYQSSANVKRLKRLGFDTFAIDGTAKYLNDNQSIFEGKVITFNQDGSITWNA